MKKKAILIAAMSVLALGVNAGDWGKAPVIPDKAPIEECLDIGGIISVGYHTDYVYKGIRLGRDTVEGHINYGIDGFFVPITIGVNYKNVIGGAPLVDDASVYMIADLGTIAGFDLALSRTQHFYPEVAGMGGNGETGVHISRDLGFVTVKTDIIYNLNVPNAFNALAGANNDNGAWYYDFGLEKTIAVGGFDLVLSTGLGYADNYWGRGPNPQTGGRSSGWNHYYVNAALPIELNCRATLTPYLGYTGAPDSFLADGFVGPGAVGAQSDILHGGVTLSVSF